MIFETCFKPSETQKPESGSPVLLRANQIEHPLEELWCSPRKRRICMIDYDWLWNFHTFCTDPRFASINCTKPAQAQDSQNSVKPSSKPWEGSKTPSEYSACAHRNPLVNSSSGHFLEARRRQFFYQRFFGLFEFFFGYSRIFIEFF